MSLSTPPPYLRWIIGAAFFTLIFPFSLLRNPEKLSFTHLAANVVILIVVIYISIVSIMKISSMGSRIDNGILAFNGRTCLIFLGMAAFSFEGIAVVIPLYKLSKEKYMVPYIFRSSIFAVCALYGIFAHICFFAFGRDTQQMITLNLNQESVIPQIIYCAYILVLIPTILVQFFPAVGVLEQRYIDTKFTGKANTIITDVFRGVVMIVNILLAILIGKHFDLALSLLGTMTCVPLGISFPGLIHLKLMAKTKRERAFDYGLIVVGFLITIMSATITIYTSIHPYQER